MSKSVPAAIEVAGLEAGYSGLRVLHGINLARCAGRIHRHPRFLRLRKDHVAADHRRLSEGHRRARIRLFGRDVVNMPPEKRGMAMMFQSYALWPHMTVLGNVGYGLRLRGVSEAGHPRARRGHPQDAQPLRPRRPQGDEPVRRTASARGARTRARDRAGDPASRRTAYPISTPRCASSFAPRSRSLQNRLGFTAIHVTHDREEAMTMADRIVVMDAGHIAQIGSPEGGLRPSDVAVRGELHGCREYHRISVIRPSASGVEVSRARKASAVMERRCCRWGR